MSKIKTLKTFKHITFIASVLLGIAALGTFIMPLRGISVGSVCAGIFFTVLSLGYLKWNFDITKQLNVVGK